ncbi:MAG: cyclic nucleotide-binding domain-containing protein [Candidatus Altimarinota bacterium]
MLKKLKNLYIFEGFEDSFLQEILNNSRVKNFKANSFVFKEGDKTENSFILISGVVSVIKSRQTVNTIFEGDIFGEIGLVLNEPRTASIKAETDIEVLEITKSSVNKILKEHSNGEFIKVTILNRIIQNHNRK